jgi:ABC-type phosphate/phosphonate transport system substrate-binding protein
MPWAQGRPVYRSDLIVRADAPFQTLEDTFGHRAAWTVRHSHSGFNAFRHHLLRYRSAVRSRLYREMVPDLVTARAILDGVRDGRFEVGPLDAYWHWLIAQHAPELTAGIRVLESTDVAPMPAFVASTAIPDDAIARLRAAFAHAATRPWFEECEDALGLIGFAPVTHDDFALTVARDQEALTAGYPLPA